MPQAYRKKIVEAFRDNAVRSVLLIDDQYVPYEEVTEKYFVTLDGLQRTTSNGQGEDSGENNLQNQLSEIKKNIETASAELMSSNIARKFVDFFHRKKLICDVENQTDQLDKDKIRKSDLIILDYHLEQESQNPAERSLNLIADLSNSKHMNMVVVYTAEPLDSVWYEVATTLKGSTFSATEMIGTDYLLEAWNLNEDDWQDEWRHIVSSEIVADYLTGDHDIDSLVQELQQACEESDLEKPERKHVEWLLENEVSKFNKNKRKPSSLLVYGSKELWLQAGDIFVVFCEKTRRDDSQEVTPEEVWERIKDALESWYPSFYRVVTSELQNQIEDANLSMEKVLSKDSTEQIAALWGVLRVHEDKRDESASELLESLLNDVVEKVRTSSDLLRFVKEVANSVDDNLPQFVPAEPDRDGHHRYLRAIVKSANKNFTGHDIDIDNDFRANVLHAFNELLSTEKQLPDYISTGVVLRDTETEEYYLCIAPGCNTIPNQITGEVIKRMTPHRPMRFIRLANKTDKMLKKLKEAQQSNTIFISDNGIRLALDIFEDGRSPTIEQGVVVKHDTVLIEPDGAKAVQFLETCPESKKLKIVERNLKLVAKLREGFASRYQNAQLQYEARIGVDLVSGIMTEN
ncbi:response regulator receiver domain [uncultured Idiomarina sp.]|uniref:response regulator receiver domain n=1 Tax=uncultured Idiomarina sp. TaxID=352961 RepID=UPI0032B2272C|tara:strand:- start:142 stop:2037 length:1896 start_codon:yes stop_codon:yes gene_type:complete